MSPNGEAWARGYRAGAQTPPAPAPAALLEFCGWQAAQRAQSLNDNPFDGGSGKVATCVTFWEHANYGGAALTLPLGQYNLATLAPWWNDKVSSLRIGAAEPQAVTVVLSENDGVRDQGGVEVTFHGQQGWAYIGDALNDKTTLVLIQEGAAPPPQAPPPPGAPPRDPRSPPPAPAYLPGQVPPAVYQATTPWDLWTAGWLDATQRGGIPKRAEAAYLAGYQAGLAGQPTSANPYPPPGAGNGKGSFVPAPAPAPRPFGGVEDPLLYPAPNPLPALNPALTYEVYATLGLQALRGGVPLDLAIIGGIALPGARFTLLGSEPADWQRGFRLSGPSGLGDGPAAAAAQYGAGAIPQHLGLPAWVVAQRKDGSVGLIRGDWLRRTFSFSQPG